MPFPREWTDALNKLREAGATDALIAGGAVRDFLLGREIKDIDFFMRSRGPEEDKRIAETAFTDAIVQHGELPEEYRLQMPELASVYVSHEGLRDYRDIFGDGQFPAQLIFLNGSEKDAYGLISRFDFGLCRAAFDGERALYTDEFLKDAFGLTMTLINADNMEKSRHRYERLSAKYPEHRWIGPS